MSERNDEQANDALKRALRLVTEAMDLHDGHEWPPEIGAHLAMAQQALRQQISASPQADPE